MELWIERNQQSENEWLFDRLAKEKQEIEDRFGDKLEWLWLDKRKAGRICIQQPFLLKNEGDWPPTIQWMCDYVEKLENAFKEPLERLSREMKSAGSS